MKTIKERIQENDTSLTFEEIINDTLEYYSKDPDSRRCTTSDGHCFYSPKNANKPNSEGCAVGRYLTEEQQNKCDSMLDNIIINVNPKYLPKFVTNNINFFYMLQSFHDDDRNFENNKVTEFGLGTIDELKKVSWLKN